MNCEITTPLLEASINNGVVEVEGTTVADAMHNYTNGGVGRGLLVEVTDTANAEGINKFLYFLQTDLNLNLLEFMNILSENLVFTMQSTDPLVLEIKSKLELIKTLIDIALPKVA